jgi:hypothetical protein
MRPIPKKILQQYDHQLAALDLLGLKMGLSKKAVQKRGITLGPMPNLQPEHHFVTRAISGLSTYHATHFSTLPSGAQTVLLSFKKNGGLNVIQVLSKPMSDGDAFPKVNAKIRLLLPYLEELFGHAKRHYSKLYAPNISKHLPIYTLQAHHIFVTLAPIVLTYNGQHYQTAYGLRYGAF